MPPERPVPPSAVPDPETLRLAALRASWRRDHEVGRRRRRWRWVVWAFWRYGVPLLLLAGTVTLLVILALAHTLES